MIRLKDNTVSVKGLKPEMVIALMILRGLFDLYSLPVVVTSGSEGFDGDGVHMKGSRHYVGEAVDIRKRQVPKDLLPEFIAKMRKFLKSDFEVIDEKHHFHIETSG